MAKVDRNSAAGFTELEVDRKLRDLGVSPMRAQVDPDSHLSLIGGETRRARLGEAGVISGD